MLKAGFLLFILATTPAMTQEHRHPPEHAALHLEFYDRWMRPDNRSVSCCNRVDCAPVKEARRINGVWMMERESDGEWMTVPDSKIENYRDDARDSPDGRTHMCSAAAMVFCAVLGSGM